MSISSIRNNQNPLFQNTSMRPTSAAGGNARNDGNITKVSGNLLNSLFQSDTVSAAASVKNVEEIGGSIAQTRSPAQEEFLNRVKGWSDEEVDNYLKYLTDNPAQPVFDIRDSLEGGKIKLTYTGQEFDSYADVRAYEVEFEKAATQVQAGKREIYEAEKAKGTAPQKIMEMFVDYDNSQSAFFRGGVGAGFSHTGDYRDYVLNPVSTQSDKSADALQSGESLIALLEETHNYNRSRLKPLADQDDTSGSISRT